MLLDVNCLLAIAWPNHQHHRLVADWFERQADAGWSTCAVSELGFVRLSSNPAYTAAHVSPREAVGLLAELRTIGRHEYLDAPSPCSFEAMRHPTMQGHRQVTDCYLLAIARSRNCSLATLDQRLIRLPFAKDCVVVLE